MFVPSESIYADLVEHFDDVVQKAHRARVVIVSPSLMMMAIEVTRTILRDARMRESAHVIQAEVGKLLNDVRLLAERAAKLESHFRQAQEDVGLIATSAEKVIAPRARASTRWSFARGGGARWRRCRTCGWRRAGRRGAPQSPRPGRACPGHPRLSRWITRSGLHTCRASRDWRRE